MAAADTARLLASLELNDSKFQAGIRRSLGGLGKLDKGMSGVGRNMGKIGKGFGKAAALVGGAAVTGLVLAGKAAIDYQEAFQGVVKTVEASPAEFDKISDALRRMSTEMPISAIELAGIAEAGGAMGIKAKDIGAFTKQVAILATTTNVSADDAATALGQLSTQVGLTAAEFDNFAAALVDLGNNGNSTESQILDIEKRAGGFAKSAGLAKDAALGWAAATANMFGDRTEMGGTALGKFFREALSSIGAGGQRLKTFAKTAGVTGKQFQKLFAKDASGALEKFIKGLGKLKGGARLATIENLFGKGSGIGKLVNDLANAFNDPTSGLAASLDTATKAWIEGTAAQAEFDKRNATVRSALTRLKNGIIDAGVSIGEGFTPAIGRAADKLSTFLKDPGNRKALEDIGKDIGKGIDSIDWDKLLGVAKSLGSAFAPALSVITKIVDLIAKLPPEVIGVGGAAIVTDKLSGGAVSSGIGGAIGGLAETFAKTLATKIPVFGKAFVQPVFVTNMGLGGVGGGIGGGAAGGGAGIASKVGGAFAILGALTAVTAAFETWQQQNASSTAQAQAIDTTLAQNIKNMNTADLQTALNGVNQGIKDIQSNPLLTLVQGEALTTLQGMKATLESQQNAVLQTPEEQAKAAIAFRESEHASSIASSALQSTTDTGLSNVATETRTGLAGTNTNVRGTTSAVQSAQGAIVGAISANRPIVTTLVDVNVTSSGVEKAVTTSTRYGDQNGSAGGGGSHDGHGWGGP